MVKNTVKKVADKAPEVIETFNEKRSFIERLGVKNPVVSAILAAVATTAAFVFEVFPL
jgi:hypothetical protein